MSQATLVFPEPLRDDLEAALSKTWSDLGRAGTWWTGAERVAIAEVARAERLERARPPHERREKSPSTRLPAAALETARRIAAEAHALDQAWAASMMSALDPAPYVEIASIVVCVAAVDAFHEAMGWDLPELPLPRSGAPSRELPPSTGDIGAWVPAQLEYEGPNVGRALSLVPDGLKSFFRLVATMYAGRDFVEMVWADRPLSRPQVELVAARVSALNECFY